MGSPGQIGQVLINQNFNSADAISAGGNLFFKTMPEKEVEKVAKGVELVNKGIGTVLLVDDEEVILEVSTALLEGLGYRVLIARNGKEALEFYRKYQKDIDFILLDMTMPIMGGGEAYDKLKEINPNIKVLLSSGYNLDGQATKILERGCDGFIQKPFNMNELVKKIREITE